VAPVTGLAVGCVEASLDGCMFVQMLCAFLCFISQNQLIHGDLA